MSLRPRTRFHDDDRDRPDPAGRLRAALPALTDHAPYRRSLTAAAGAESRLDQLEAALRDAGPADREAIAERVHLARGDKADADAAVDAAANDARAAFGPRALCVWWATRRTAMLAALNMHRAWADAAAAGLAIAARGLADQYAAAGLVADLTPQLADAEKAFRSAVEQGIGFGLIDPAEPAAQWTDPTE